MTWPLFLRFDVSFKSIPYLMSEWQQDCLGKKQWVLIFLQNIYKLEITRGYHFFSSFIDQLSKLRFSSLHFFTLDYLPLFIEHLLSAIKNIRLAPWSLWPRLLFACSIFISSSETEYRYCWVNRYTQLFPSLPCRCGSQ